MSNRSILVIFLALGVASGALLAQDAVPQPEDVRPTPKSYSPFAGESYPKNVYWGDTHLHTSNSFDAGFVNFRVGPEEAFRFARGEEVTANGGMAVKLVRPLDFLVVSDHAEFLGLTPALRRSDPVLLETETGRPLARHAEDRRVRGDLPGGDGSGPQRRRRRREDQERGLQALDVAGDGPDRRSSEPAGSVHRLHRLRVDVDADGNNLHRVVIFKDDAERATRVVPFSLFDSQDPEDLWEYMAAYEDKTGGNVLAIPHNGNLSNGIMFAVETLSGEPLTRDYAERRMKWEPLYEITQIKGDGEAHPALSPNDEFADYGTWDKGNLPGTQAKEQSMLQHEYGRSAWKLGLDSRRSSASTRSSSAPSARPTATPGLATAKEDNFFGKHSGLEPDTHRATDHKVLESPIDDELTTWGWEQVAGGLAAVWSTENTRAGLFEAMERKETYATTGSRMTVRFFGGWDFSERDIQRPSPAKVGYEKGVPMGGDLRGAPAGKSASFLVWALRDPEGANLDRIQIIKGWRDGDGNLKEKVYDVAWSDDRRPGGDGKLPPVGDTVDVENATYTNTIGDVLLAAAWTDPDFDAAERAFYYARVIEIPTPAWTAHDAKYFDLELDAKAEMKTQERAYTSPIWYTP